MGTIKRNQAPTSEEIETFVKSIDFILPEGFLHFYEKSNGADLYSEKMYLILWPLTDMITLNIEYNVNEFAPEFFIFGSDGGGTAYAIEKNTGFIYEMPFNDMSKEESVFMNESFIRFLESI